MSQKKKKNSHFLKGGSLEVVTGLIVFQSPTQDLFLMKCFKSLNYLRLVALFILSYLSPEMLDKPKMFLMQACHCDDDEEYVEHLEADQGENCSFKRVPL